MRTYTTQEIEEKMEVDFLQWVDKKLNVKKIDKHELVMYKNCFYAGCHTGSDFFHELVLSFGITE